MKLQDFDFRIYHKKYRYINEKNKDIILIKGDEKMSVCLDISPYSILTMKYLNCYDVILELWTGYYDKNGKKIYEGDIISCNNYTYTINFIEGEFRLYSSGNCFHSTWSDFNYELQHSIKVIGNIHENKDLLEKNNE